MRFQLIILLLTAMLSHSCARRDPAVESVIGSEPQRLSFGPPPEVLHSFVEKMKLCWFSPARGSLPGYTYETGEVPAGQDGSADGYQNVKIFNGGGGAPVFEVQFHKYNDNTLIVTKNIALPDDMLAKLKRNIQLWALTGNDCTT